MQDLGRALTSAMAESSEVSDTLRRLRSSGYALYLSLDCKRGGEVRQEPLPVAATSGVSAANASSSGEPNFQINGDDLRFLRSIGIDPTRRCRTRRRRGA
ncbi:MAG: hypothetical protein KDD11_22725 [Acidobacteria bacterium]|nr:hypothetical protein [Acidobacteriota bacterium]